jgi:hypothetical protein
MPFGVENSNTPGNGDFIRGNELLPFMKPGDVRHKIDHNAFKYVLFFSIRDILMISAEFMRLYS